MRKLFLMLGAPASGKSTWIKQNNLESYTISPDNIRELMGNYHSYYDPESGQLDFYGFDGREESKVWNIVYDVLETRMSKGQTIFVDATHLFKHAFDRYVKLASKNQYNYEVYLVDFMKSWFVQYDNDPEQVIKHLDNLDSQRNRHVGKDVITRFVYKYRRDYIKQNVTPDSITRISPGDVFASLIRNAKESLTLDKADMSKFDTIKVIGDVHGDYTNLLKVFDNHKKGTAYVFVGDYLDRGDVKHMGDTLKFLTSLKGNNIFFLRGNHELQWTKYIHDKDATIKGGFNRTIKVFTEQLGWTHEQLQSELNKLNVQLKDYLYFKPWFISHAGLDPMLWNSHGYLGERHLDCTNLELMDERDVVCGLPHSKDGNEYSVNVDEDILQSYSLNKQIHGHRNAFGVSYLEDKWIGAKVYNLTDETNFRYVVLTKDNYGRWTQSELVELKHVDNQSPVSRFVEDPDVKQIELEDGLVANNFTREVFNNNRWTPTTLNARGMFTRNDEIVGRGFKKFFNLNQTPYATLDSLEYPVTIMRKHNGFLAIAFFDDKTNKFQVFSKGGGKEFSNLARHHIVGDMETYNTILIPNLLDESGKHGNGYSLLFEVIDPIVDPHIVYYGEPHAIPLAFVKNDMTGEVKPYTNNLGFIGVANNREELNEILEKNQKENPTQEGVVLYAQNKMLKIKSPFYLKAKELRGALENKKLGKKYWHYGAKDWYKWCKAQHITQFSPELALRLWTMEHGED